MKNDSPFIRKKLSKHKYYGKYNRLNVHGVFGVCACLRSCVCACVRECVCVHACVCGVCGIALKNENKRLKEIK